MARWREHCWIFDGLRGPGVCGWESNFCPLERLALVGNESLFPLHVRADELCEELWRS